MAERPTAVTQRAQIAAQYEVEQSEIVVQRRLWQEMGRYETFDPKMIKNCHQKLITNG